ncbi:MAG: four helix bundle protein [Bacteroidetes bacterium]|nr:four helix bundle protein [Bacteroidota bacterium]
MNKEELKDRTKKFALRIIQLAGALPNTKTGNVISHQIIRPGTSVGANYRSACRAKSTKDFINKLNIIEEEADETMYWLEIINEAQLLKPELLTEITLEANQLTAIFTAAGKTSKIKLNQK